MLATPVRAWASVAVSGSGNTVAVVDQSGYIYVSNDGGAAWTPRMTDAERTWASVALSADGATLVAVEADNGTMHSSADSG
ncbi:hypothetical protein OFO11_36450, partial [Escherichia coli]|nr:hypothetical protein [Escherichia coli]